VVGTSTDNTNADSVALVPSSITIDDIDAISCVEVVNGTFTVDFPDLQRMISIEPNKLLTWSRDMPRIRVGRRIQTPAAGRSH